MFSIRYLYPIAILSLPLIPIVAQAQPVPSSVNLRYRSTLSVPSSYNGPACIALGMWSGDANVRLEAQSFYSSIQILNSTGSVTEALSVNVNPSLGYSITVLSDRTLSLELQTGNCKLPNSGGLRTQSLYWNRK